MKRKEKEKETLGGLPSVCHEISSLETEFNYCFQGKRRERTVGRDWWLITRLTVPPLLFSFFSKKRKERGRRWRKQKLINVWHPIFSLFPSLKEDSAAVERKLSAGCQVSFKEVSRGFFFLVPFFPLSCVRKGKKEERISRDREWKVMPAEIHFQYRRSFHSLSFVLIIGTKEEERNNHEMLLEKSLLFSASIVDSSLLLFMARDRDREEVLVFNGMSLLSWKKERRGRTCRENTREAYNRTAFIINCGSNLCLNPQMMNGMFVRLVASPSCLFPSFFSLRKKGKERQEGIAQRSENEISNSSFSTPSWAIFRSYCRRLRSLLFSLSKEK